VIFRLRLLAYDRCNALQYTGWMREIHWSDEAEDHIRSRHQVTPPEVEQIVYTRPRWVTKGRDDTTYVLGQTDAR